MGARRKGREYALQTIYLVDITKMDPDKAFGSLTRGEKLDPKILSFSNSLAHGVLGKLEELDKLIVQYSQNWEMKRMAALDRNILRLGAYELLFHDDTPVSVVIDEAVELAKQYSTNDSGKFVNGILDKIKNARVKKTKKPHVKGKK